MERVSKKRSRSDQDQDTVNLLQVATKRRATGTPPKDEIPPTVRWSTPFGPTCLLGEVGTVGNRECAIFFDLDDTLIRSISGARVPTRSEDWQWLYTKVPHKLQELYADGYEIFIVSNQLCNRKHTSREDFYAQWKKKLDLVAQEIPDVSFRILASTAEDLYRKPLPGMWYAITKLYEQNNCALDPTQVIFVGDAGGRPNDHSASDKLFAENIKVDFKTPDEYFLDAPSVPSKLRGFHPRSVDFQSNPIQPSRTPLAPTNKLTIVVFVGFPGIGKTTAYRKHFEPKGYVRVDATSFKSLNDRMEAIEKAVKAKKSVVIDDTNPDKYTRRDYIDFARKRNIDIRCVYFDGTIEHAWHNNVYRAHCMSDSAKLYQDTTVMTNHRELKKFKAAFESPLERVQFTAKNSKGTKVSEVSWKIEGFKDLKTIYWKFDGTEDDLRRYMMWLFKLPN